jgi:hypothetical protein
MPKFCVRVREIYIGPTWVEADDWMDAIRRVADGEGDVGEIEYSHTLPPEQWDVEDEEGKLHG